MNTFQKIYRQKDVFKLLSSNVISEFGDWIAILALQTWMVYVAGASVWQISMLFTIALLPKVILSPIVGVILDKYNRRNILIITNFLAFIVASLFYFIESIPMLLCLVFLLNTLATVDYPAAIGIIRKRVDKELLQDTIGITFLISNIMKIVAPIGAAILISLIDIKLMFLINSLTFFVAFILSLLISKDTNNQTIHNEEPSTSTNSKLWVINDLRATIKHIMSIRTLLLSFVITFSFLYTMNAMEVSIVIFVHSLTQNPVYYSLFLSIVGVGGTLGALVSLKFQKKFSKLNYALASMVLSGILMLMIPLSVNIFVAMLIAFLMGIAVPGIIMPVEVLRQSLVDEKMSSRIAGFSTSFSSISQLAGASSAGLLLYLLGSGGVFIFGGILLVALSLIGFTHIKYDKGYKETISSTKTMSSI
ncbi:MAG: MFS transporter [Bacillaceae bacterium]|nr:MFS transporter [Bacillaceae bacterium]